MIYYCNIIIWKEIEKSKVLIQFLLISRKSGDVLFFLYARSLRGYTATLPLFVKGHSHGQSSFLFSMRSAHRCLFHIEITIVESSQSDQSPVLTRIMNEDLCSLMAANVITTRTFSSDGVHTLILRRFLFSWEFLCSFRRELWNWWS